MTPILNHFVNGSTLEGTSGRLSDIFDPNTGQVSSGRCCRSCAPRGRAVLDQDQDHHRPLAGAESGARFRRQCFRDPDDALNLSKETELQPH